MSRTLKAKVVYSGPPKDDTALPVLGTRASACVACRLREGCAWRRRSDVISRCFPVFLWPASFPAGPPKAMTTCAPGEEPVKFELVNEASAGSKKRKWAVTAAWEEGECKARITDVGAVAKYYVGVYNKSTQRLELHDARQIAQLRYNVDDGGVAEARESGEGGLGSPAFNYMERRRLLVETFGSKRKQRAQAASDANKIGADTISAAKAVAKQLIAEGQRVLDESGGVVDAAATGTCACTCCVFWAMCGAHSLLRALQIVQLRMQRWRLVQRCCQA